MTELSEHTAAAYREPEPAAPWLPDVGDTVWFAYWRPFPLPGNPNHGTWETSDATLIAPGNNGRFAVEVSNPGTDPGSAAVNGSHLRYLPAARVYPDRETAQRAAVQLPNPNPT